MPTPRITELPDEVRALIEKNSGPITDMGTVAGGLNSSIAACVRTGRRAPHTLFVKGLPLDHPRVWTQAREAKINPHVRDVTPALHWYEEADGWSLLGFEYVEGDHADYTPGASDLSQISATMGQLARLRAPGVELKTMTDRFRKYVESPAELKWFEGDSLLHTDWNPHNVIMTKAGAVLVDWAWASTGAAWIDPALWLLWLIAHGHTAEQAESVAAEHPAWKTAPPAGLDTLARVQERLWDSIAEQSPDDWSQSMKAAARAWNTHRQSQY
ncbi:aminoglycoside phosphotransferase [Streptomyces sp. NPDC005236]|uniref:aminoglycoside phosphotransferase n=1 Tax=Streptomyces sp. NPDC005236 TaxID=3157028 RepID=UPI0033A0FE60